MQLISGAPNVKLDGPRYAVRDGGGLSCDKDYARQIAYRNFKSSVALQYRLLFNRKMDPGYSPMFC
jgi:hypothetical protein